MTKFSHSFSCAILCYAIIYKITFLIISREYDDIYKFIRMLTSIWITHLQTILSIQLITCAQSQLITFVLLARTTLSSCQRQCERKQEKGKEKNKNKSKNYFNIHIHDIHIHTVGLYYHWNKKYMELLAIGRRWLSYNIHVIFLLTDLWFFFDEINFS